MVHLFIKSAKIFTLVLLSGALAFAQQAPSSAASQSSSNQVQQQAAPATGFSSPVVATPSNNGVAQPGFLTPIYGLQGVLAETVDGSTVAAQSIDERFNPASAVKLATALVALQSLGPEHRFVTSLWAGGKIDKTSGTLTGDLTVTGGDSSF